MDLAQNQIWRSVKWNIKPRDKSTQLETTDFWQSHPKHTVEKT
jgi:hypothetical protein